MTDPLDSVEFGNTMDNVAQLAGRFFRGLIEEGFTRSEALMLTKAWLGGAAQPPASEGGTT